MSNLLGSIKGKKRTIVPRRFSLPPDEKAPSLTRMIELDKYAASLARECDSFADYAEAWDWIESHNMQVWFEFALVNLVEWFCFRRAFFSTAMHLSQDPILFFKERMQLNVETWDAFVEQGDRWVELSKQPSPDSNRADEKAAERELASKRRLHKHAPKAIFRDGMFEYEE